MTNPSDRLVPHWPTLRTLWRRNRIRTRFFLFTQDITDALYIEGNRQQMRNKDTDLLFRQDSSFLYLTGADMPHAAFWMDSDISVLFVKRLDEHDFTWTGEPVSNAQLKDKYGVDDVLYLDEFEQFLDSRQRKRVMMDGTPRFVDPDLFQGMLVDDEALREILDDIRAVKSPEEIDIIKQVCKVSSDAHTELMRISEPGMNEYNFDSYFRYYTGARGCKHQAYIPIVGSGYYSSILHYNDNDKFVDDGDLVLVDAGAEYFGYASDITRTFPANGVFTDDQALIYGIVLRVQKQLITDLRPGRTWKDVSLQARDLLIDELMQHNFLRGKKDDIIKSGVISKLFMPHGIGHHIGLDVHDSTIFPDVLEAGMIVTIEPGVYFNQYLVDKALEDEELCKVLNTEKLKAFRDFGGVRIEDNILITPDGHQLITFAPREIEEIERIMQK